MTQIYRFTADAGESVGAASDATTGCFFGGRGGAAATRHVRGKRPLPRTIAGGLDCRWAGRKIFHFRRVPVAAGPGFSSMRKIIFGQQPPKQPLAQNKNGSRFGCLVCY